MFVFKLTLFYIYVCLHMFKHCSSLCTYFVSHVFVDTCVFKYIPLVCFLIVYQYLVTLYFFCCECLLISSSFIPFLCLCVCACSIYVCIFVCLSLSLRNCPPILCTCFFCLCISVSIFICMCVCGCVHLCALSIFICFLSL